MSSMECLHYIICTADMFSSPDLKLGNNLVGQWTKRVAGTYGTSGFKTGMFVYFCKNFVFENVGFENN